MGKAQKRPPPLWETASWGLSWRPFGKEVLIDDCLQPIPEQFLSLTQILQGILLLFLPVFPERPADIAVRVGLGHVSLNIYSHSSIENLIDREEISEEKILLLFKQSFEGTKNEAHFWGLFCVLGENVAAVPFEERTVFFGQPDGILPA